MKGIFSLLLCFGILLSSSGCGDGEISAGSLASSEPVKNSPEAALTSALVKAELSSFKDDREKTVTFVSHSDDKISPWAEISINKYLYELGKDYKVEFIYLDTLYYRKSLYTRMKAKEPVDIVFTGFDLSGDSPDDYFLENDSLLCLDDFLATEKGAEILTLLPSNIWDAAKRDGKIYGIYTNPYISPPTSYTVNKRVMEKYGIKPEELEVPPEQLGDILRKVKAGEEDDFIPFFCSILDLYYNNKNYISQSIFAVDRSTMKAGLLIDMEPIPTMLKAFHNYSREGLLSRKAILHGTVTKKDTTYLDDYFIIYDVEPTIPRAFMEHMLVKETGVDAVNGEDYLVITPKGSKAYMDTTVLMATGVYKESLNKEEALDFLALTLTDKKTTDLMHFGVEGIEYTLNQEGHVVMDHNIYNPFNSYIYGNTFISTPLYYEHKDKNKLYLKYYENTEPTPFVKMPLNLNKGNIDKIQEFQSIDIELRDLIMPEKNLTYDEVIRRTRAEFKKAGSDKMLAHLQSIVDEGIKKQGD